MHLSFVLDWMVSGLSTWAAFPLGVHSFFYPFGLCVSVRARVLLRVASDLQPLSFLASKTLLGFIITWVLFDFSGFQVYLGSPEPRLWMSATFSSLWGKVHFSSRLRHLRTLFEHDRNRRHVLFQKSRNFIKAVWFSYIRKSLILTANKGFKN